MSEAIGFIILIMIILIALIPLTLVMLSQPNNQLNQINNAQLYKNTAKNQYSLFQSIQQQNSTVMPSVFFIYNKSGNNVEFILTDNLSTPLIIKYLMVFNGSNWVYLDIIKNNSNIIIAKPINSVPNNISGLLVSPSNNNTMFGQYPAIKIQLSGIRPYENQSNDVVAVTQYGNIIYAVQGVSPPKTGYIYEGFMGTATQNAFPNIINYYPQGSSGSYFGNPFLQLANSVNGQATDGLVIWSQQYVQGGNFTITIVGTYTIDWFAGGHGFNFYLFMNPTHQQWSISQQWNSSSNFPVILGYSYYPYKSGGSWALPESSTPYIMVAWDSGWGTFYSPSPNGGMWDVWWIYNPNDQNTNPIAGTYPSNLSFTYPYWQGAYDKNIVIKYYSIGQGDFTPNPGDLIIISVTYDSQNNMIYGFAYDYNTSNYTTLQFNLNKLGFKPPKSGIYEFAIGSGNAWLQANWGLLYVNNPLLQYLFNPLYGQYIQQVEQKLHGGLPP